MCPKKTNVTIVLGPLAFRLLRSCSIAHCAERMLLLIVCTVNMVQSEFFNEVDFDFRLSIVADVLLLDRNDDN